MYITLNKDNIILKVVKLLIPVKKIPFVLDKMQNLHKATTKSPVYWLNIFFGLSLLFFVISAFWMFLPSTTVFKKGIYFSLLGIIMTVIILFYLRALISLIFSNNIGSAG